MAIDWRGVYPAITTPFREDGAIDLDLLSRHARWLMEAGCAGLIGLGSLGEGGTLDEAERSDVLRTLVAAAAGRGPVISGVGALSTRAACRLAEQAAGCGCRGLMVLPAYAYVGRWRETREHLSAVMRATTLECMLYNNPIAYGTDVSAAETMELAARHANLRAVKESTADVRRVTALRHAAGDRLAILVGVDDLIVEGLEAGAVGWVAGLANAFPRESVRLFEWAREGRVETDGLYRWFLPLLKLDVVPEFVHLIKLAQREVGWGSERVRGPRVALEGGALESALEVIRRALATRPAV